MLKILNRFFQSFFTNLTFAVEGSATLPAGSAAAGGVGNTAEPTNGQGRFGTRIGWIAKEITRRTRTTGRLGSSPEATAHA